MSTETVAFLLVVFAGLSTGIGAGVVYSKRLIILASRAVLGAALGLSTGVMLYVSFVEIFVKSIDAFEANFAGNTAYLFATLSFFGGILMMKGLNFAVHQLDTAHISHGEIDEDMIAYIKNELDGDSELVQTSDIDPDSGKYDDDIEVVSSSKMVPSKGDGNVSLEGRIESFDRLENENGVPKEIIMERMMKETDQKLEKMGVMTALAIALHNFPEGLATFVAAIDDPSVGIALAIAIAIHNIPEGLCVSIPVYFSSKNRTRAFLWGFISGLSEIVGAGLGWIILKDQFDDNVYGILFGLVAGMMVSICIYELLPTAHRYDPQDKYVSNFTMIGMMIMAVSLIVFLY